MLSRISVEVADIVWVAISENSYLDIEIPTAVRKNVKIVAIQGRSICHFNFEDVMAQIICTADRPV
jgi:hypothetical protein